MATETQTQELIIDVKVESDKAVQRQVDLKNSLDAAKQAYNDIIKEQGKNSEAAVKQEAVINQLNQQLRNNGTVLKQMANDSSEVSGAYAALNKQAADAALRAKDMAAAYGMNDERTKEAQKAAKAYSDQLKEVDSAVGQNHRRVGDYAGEIGKLSGTFSQMPGVMGKMGGAVEGVTTGLKAFNLASPMGWITMLISIVSGLIEKFSSFAPVMDSITNGFAKMGAIFDVLKNSVIAVITGQKSLGEAISGASAEMKKQTDEAGRLAQAQRDLDDKTELLAISQEKYKNQINELLLQSKNMSLSEKERMKLIDEALILEGKAYREKKKLADDEVKLIQDKLIKQGGLNAYEAQQLRKKGVDYARYKENQRNLDDQTIKDLASALVKQQQIEGESIALREKALNRKETLDQKAAEKAAKRAELKQKAEEKRLEEEERKAQERADAELKRINDYIDAQKKAIETSKELRNDAQAQEEEDDYLSVKRMMDARAIEYQAEYELKKSNQATMFEAELMALDASYQAQIAAAKKVGADTTAITELYEQQKTAIKRKETEAALDLASGFAGNLATIFGKNTKLGKMAASAQIAIDTYKGAIAAYNSLVGVPVVGIPLGIAAAAAVTATGVRAIRDVWAVKSGLPGDSGSGSSSVKSPTSSVKSPTSSSANVTGSLVSRQSGQTQQKAINQGITTAIQQNQFVPVLVTSDVTSVVENKVMIKNTNSL